jgi:Colicin V production protein.
MSIFLDVLTVAVFVIVIYRAYKIGLLRALFDFLGFIVSFGVAIIFSGPVGDWLDKTFFSKLVQGTVEHFATSGSESNKQFFTNLIGTLPQTVGNSLSGINSALGKFGSDAMKNLANSVSMPLSAIISRSIAFFAILIACLIIIGIVSHLTEIIRHFPVISTLNAFGGIIIGVVEAVIAMFVVSTLISLFISLMALQKNPPITAASVNATFVYKYIQNMNPLTGMLLKK